MHSLGPIGTTYQGKGSWHLEGAGGYKVIGNAVSGGKGFKERARVKWQGANRHRGLKTPMHLCIMPPPAQGKTMVIVERCNALN